MRVNTLLYHDVIENGRYTDSGFAGRGADVYKLDRRRFAEDLDRFAATLPERILRFDDLVLPGERRSSPFSLRPAAGRGVLLTFDDGGSSAHAVIADELEKRGFRGVFFVTTDYIDQPGFLTRPQIRDLHRRGHAIGSHSGSHPERISGLPFPSLLDEWVRSADRLANILGDEIATASVPGGFYSFEVARAASFAGIRVLFTSEPTDRHWRVESALVFGRYTVSQWTSSAHALAMARGDLYPCLRQWSIWNAKKAAKTVAGPLYARARTALLGARMPYEAA
ncbi:MAG TPA: polysaccharide deacetylase family protein [Polyangiaceae bacterium]|nr:polysaccharide deacetylase family protein [Polyangiaceae bacterium]